MIGAVEAGGTKFVLALADDAGKIVERAQIPTTTPAKTFCAMGEFFRAGTAPYGALRAFGIGSFGPIELDPHAADWGTITTTPKPGWSGASFSQALGEFAVPLAIDTDVNAAALGEWLAGAGRGCSTVAYTTVGTGVGTGVVHGGAALRGAGHYEAGHIRVPRAPGDTFAGVCPYHGDCLEGLASGPAIAARWGASLDALGAAEVEIVAGYLADFAAALMLLHMPQRLIFGGGVMKSPRLLAALCRLTEGRLGGYVAAAAVDPGLERTIVAPALGDDAGISGAVELGRRILHGV